MKAVIQRVNKAVVHADGEFSGKCEKGLLILLGVKNGDTEEDALLLAEKISKLRIFTDENDKMNFSLRDIGGEALVVSNFTLSARCEHGNRPEFLEAAPPTLAKELYLHFLTLLEARIEHVGHGQFGASMSIDMQADGPVTIILDSLSLRKKGGKNQ